MAKRHNVEVGDEILVDEYIFVVTEMHIIMNQAPQLRVKSPLELPGYKFEEDDDA